MEREHFSWVGGDKEPVIRVILAEPSILDGLVKSSI